MQNLEQFCNIVITKLSNHGMFKEAKQLIISKHRWEDGHINDQVFRDTIEAYRDIASNTSNWTHTEQVVADVIDQAIYANEQDIKKEMLTAAWKYRDGLLEEEELRQKAAIEYKRMAKARLQPTQFNYSFY